MGIFLLLLLLLLLPSSGSALDFRYHRSQEMEAFLKGIRGRHPTITHLYSIGKSVKGREMWVMAVGRSPAQHKIGIPEFKYVANVRGDEVIGREMILHLIEFLVTNDQTDPVITKLINQTRMHFLPSVNPDGFAVALVGHCLSKLGRNNANEKDLSKNFPDPFTINNEVTQPETKAVMKWIHDENFILSALLHGGGLVASYPFDNGNHVTVDLKGVSKTVDHDVFVYLAKLYSIKHRTMHKEIICESGDYFKGGITNGYRWFPVKGSMQDYNYIWGQCFDMTLELSCCPYPLEDKLESFWEDNKIALVEYIKQVHLGVKGRVFNPKNEPIADVIVEVQGRRHICPYKTNKYGEYYLLLLPGVYILNATIPGFMTLQHKVTLTKETEKLSAHEYNFIFPQEPPEKKALSCPLDPLYSNTDSKFTVTVLSVHFLIFVYVVK